MSITANRARREQTASELGRLEREVAAWVDHRRVEDEQQQYWTQLGAVETLVSGAATALATGIDDLDLSLPREQLYGECRLYDLRVVWLRRVWEFFSEKFDQRDDPALGPVLRAADEVVWSCFREVFRRAERDFPTAPGPAPLPFVDARYSPEAFPADLVPGDLKSDVDLGFLADHLRRLPIPVVRVQPACVTSPWWLVFLAHEVGHHVQYGLLDGMQLVERFRSRIEQAVLDARGDEADAARWGRWSRELFADAFSVVAVGGWAVRAMVELELQSRDAMLKRRGQYPAPAVRLLLLARLAAALGLAGTSSLGGLELEQWVATDAESAHDLELAPAVVDVAMGELPELGVTLAWLLDFEQTDFVRAVPDWASDLREAAYLPGEPGLRSPRLLAGAAVAAWCADVEAGADGHGELAARTIEAIVRSREPGRRGGLPGREDGAEIGVELGRLLTKAGPEALEA